MPRHEVRVLAAPEICYQVIAGAGRVLERYPNGERLVEFDTVADGQRVITKEVVRGQPPDRIDYRWVQGPLPTVEETITIARAEDGALVRYEGRFGVAVPWPVRVLLRWWIARRFARAVHEHLQKAKEIAERRARRSRLYPREDRDEHRQTTPS